VYTDYHNRLQEWQTEKATWNSKQIDTREQVKETRKRERDEETQKKEAMKAEKESRKLRVGGFNTIAKDLDNEYQFKNKSVQYSITYFL
jgi:hypothetical protein